MKIRTMIFAGTAVLMPFCGSYAQSAFDAYSLSQSDLRGTARFMSMAGAFGALGGDLSVLNQNPGGIGIYRSSEVGFTLDWNIQKTSTNGGSYQETTKETNFNFNNVGYVGTFRLGLEALPSINFGFTYNKVASFNRHYSGGIRNIGSSMTNYIAGQTNVDRWTVDDLGAVRGGYNPYQESYAPWISILAYNSYMINPATSDGDIFGGLSNSETTGSGKFETDESGYVNEYSISLGGNVYNTVYWGISVGITDLQYSAYTYYGEDLTSATVPYERNSAGDISYGNGYASWGLENMFRMSGTGVNFKMGVILKPINELRIGVAFHTPTFYSLKSEYIANTSYGFESLAPNTYRDIYGTATTDEGYWGETWFDVSSPWKFMGSVAAVLGGRGIVSFDYERDIYPTMRVSYDGTEDRMVTENIKQYYKASNIFRIGGEFKATPNLSIRAGYSCQTSPVSEDIKEDKLNVVTAGTTLSYTLDDKTQYVTAGLGYRYKAFYVDGAFVHKNRKSVFHAFSPDFDAISPSSEIKDKNNEIVLTLGFKF